jgi:hypothetical protein
VLVAGCLVLAKIKYSKKFITTLGEAIFTQGMEIRFFFASAMAAFLVGFERGFKHDQDVALGHFDFMHIYVAWR